MIISDIYAAHITNTIRLIRSAVIKSEVTADRINQYLELSGDTIPAEKSNWKYYRNISGQRYIGSSVEYSDPIIYVHSIDTNDSILFDVTTLRDNPKTRGDFRKYGDSYKNLLAQYPEQELYIRGVINPTFISTAVNADNYTILQLDSNYHGVLEGPALKKHLQNWINNYTHRWDIPAFSITDSLYPVCMLSNLYLLLVLEVINFRLANSRSNIAHQFHVRNYLGGYYYMDKYVNKLSVYQELFLMRNLNYLAHNGGNIKSLDFLYERFISEAGIELTEFNIHQNNLLTYANINKGILDNTPTINVSVKSYRPDISNKVVPAIISPSDLTKKMINGAVLNKANLNYDTERLVKCVTHTPNNNINVGALEYVSTNNTLVKLVDVTQERLSNWFYLAAKDLIKYTHRLNLPHLNINNLFLNANNAAILIMYAGELTFKDTPDIIPHPVVNGIMKFPDFTVAAIKGLMQRKFLRGRVTNHGVTKTWNRYDDVISSQTYEVACTSLIRYNQHIEKVINSKIQHFFLLGLEPNNFGKAQLRSLIEAFYTSYECVYTDDITYVEFFNRIGLDYTTLKKKDFLEIATVLLKYFIDANIGYDSNSDITEALINILRTLSSYKIQYVRGNNGIYAPIDWCFNNVEYLGSIRNGQNDETILIPIIDILTCRSETKQCTIVLDIEFTYAKRIGFLLDDIEFIVTVERTYDLTTIPIIDVVAEFTHGITTVVELDDIEFVYDTIGPPRNYISLESEKLNVSGEINDASSLIDDSTYSYSVKIEAINVSSDILSIALRDPIDYFYSDDLNVSGDIISGSLSEMSAIPVDDNLNTSAIVVSGIMRDKYEYAYGESVDAGATLLGTSNFHDTNYTVIMPKEKLNTSGVIRPTSNYHWTLLTIVQPKDKLNTSGVILPESSYTIIE